MQIVLDKCTYISVVPTTHSNIPTTLQSDQKLSKNHPGSQEPAVVRLPAGLSTSNSLRAKANDRSPTIAIPSIMALCQSRPSFGEFQAAVTNERPVGAGERAYTAPPDGTALQSPCLAGSFEGIAMAKPPLVKENTIRLPKCKSPKALGALEPTKDTQKIEDELESSKCPRLVANACRDEGQLDKGGMLKVTMTLSTLETGLEETGEGDHHSAVPAQPAVSLRDSAFETSTSCSTTDQKAAGQEAASTQAVNRGHKVEMSEVPDQDDDTSFMMNMKANLTPTIEVAVTSPTVIEPSWVDAKAEKVPHEWLKPFGAEWTLHGIVQAKTESEVKAILKNWIHKARAEEVMDSMIEGMRNAMRVDALWWLKELRQPKHYISAISGKDKDLTIDVQIEILGNSTKIATTALVDSGCTSSAINRAFVKKHNIPTHATAAPIPVYNADGTRNQGGSITQYAEI